MGKNNLKKIENPEAFKVKNIATLKNKKEKNLKVLIDL